MSLTNKIFETHFETIYSPLHSLQCLIDDPLHTDPISEDPLHFRQ